MTSGTITTKGSPSRGDRGRGPASAGPRSSRPPAPGPRRRGTVLLLAALALLAVGLGVQDLRHTSWYQDWRLSRMSLAALQRERGGRLDDPRLLYYIGVRLNQQGRFAEADPYLRNAVGLDPDSPRLRDAWSEALLRSGLITAAFSELREFAGTHPDSAPAHLLLGKFYMTQDSMRRASEELSRAVALDPSLGEGWSYLAAAQSGLNHLTEAEAAEERAVALRPKSAKDRLGLALLLAGIGQTDRARRAFAQAATLSPQSAAVHREYARCLLEAGGSADCSQAEAEARRALALDPADPITPLILGRVLAAQGRPDAAVPFLKRAADLSPHDPTPALALAQAYRRLHQDGPARAWEQIHRARQWRGGRKLELVTDIQKDPKDPRPHRRLARMLAEEGDVAGCLRHQAEALRCAPDAPPALVAAASDLTEAGRPAEALRLAQRAKALAPNNPMAREAIGDSLLALGQPQEAAVAYRQAARGMPNREHLYQERLQRYARQHTH